MELLRSSARKKGGIAPTVRCTLSTLHLFCVALCAEILHVLLCLQDVMMYWGVLTVYVLLCLQDVCRDDVLRSTDSMFCCAYRTYAEMMYSGVLSSQDVDDIVTFSRYRNQSMKLGMQAGTGEDPQ